MYDRILMRMRELVCGCEYVMTVHARIEMDKDGLALSDIEDVVRTGRIVERQRDQVSGEWKYLINGQSLAGDDIIVVVKVSPTGKLVFITVFRE